MKEKQALYKIGNGELIIMLPKEFDHHSAKEITEQSDWYIISSGIQTVIFDFKNTEFMDSSGVGAVIGRYKLVKGRGAVKALNINPSIDRILTISGLYKIMEKVEK
ncbi:MAG: anti-sigma factor antagonist [Eubacterium sp.]|nr:anti-sigma factor antagonist [Eubacterium sp.]